MGRRFYDTTLILTGKICPYCGQPTEYVDSAALYHGISYGMIYLCRKCDAYVGVHRGTDKALGRLANRSLREWKNGLITISTRFPVHRLSTGYGRNIFRAYRTGTRLTDGWPHKWVSSRKYAT